MSKIPDASLNFSVIFSSCLDGFRFPDGWLCAIMNPVAPTFSASPNTIRTSMIHESIPPLDTLNQPIVLFDLFK